MNRMHDKRGAAPRARGFTLVELLVVIGIIALLISILLPSLNRAREMSNRIKCASNLRQIGQAMTLYANENNGNYPRTYYIPFASDATATLTDTGADANPGLGFDVPNPFDPSVPVGTNNVCAAIFLLLRTQNIGSEVFICPSSESSQDTYGGGTNAAKDRSNFTDKQNNLSYGFAVMYPVRFMGGQGRSHWVPGAPPVVAYGWDQTSLGNPEFAMGADIGPASSAEGLALTITSSSTEQRAGNSRNHDRAGQNVLYGDGHVQWSDNMFCGRSKDPIFRGDTNQDSWAGEVDRFPVDGIDSMLVPISDTIAPPAPPVP